MSHDTSFDPHVSGELCFHILYNEWYKPYVDGEINRDKIEDEISMRILAGDFPPMNQKEVNIGMELVKELVDEARFGTMDDSDQPPNSDVPKR